MNNHRMCKMVFDTLSNSSIEKSTLGKADRVTFEYYQGRYELHHLRFRKARESLLWSFNNCHVRALQQKRYSPITTSTIADAGLFSSISLLHLYPSGYCLRQTYCSGSHWTESSGQ